LSREARHLGHDLPRSAADLTAPDGGHDAIGALGVAAHRDLDPGLEAPLSMHRQFGGEAAFFGDPEARTRDAGPSCAKPLAEVRDRARPERDVDEGVLAEDPIALCFGVAPADGDDALRIALLQHLRV